MRVALPSTVFGNVGGLVCPVGPAQAGFYNLSRLDSLAHFFCKEQESSIVPKLPSTGRGAQASGDEAWGERVGADRPGVGGLERRGQGRGRAGPRRGKPAFPAAGGWGWTLFFTEAAQASCHSLVYVLIRSRQPLVLQKGGVSMAVILYYFVLEIPSFLSFFFNKG